MSSANFQVVARGPEVGQVMLIPKDGIPLPLLDFHKEVANLLDELVGLTNEAFRSVQGERPRYIVAGRCSANGELRYLVYAPELQPLGCPDVIADLNGTARARAWSPEETASHLKDVFVEEY